MSESHAFAFVFPGQGSQNVGMQAELSGQYPAVAETYAEASEILQYDLWELARQGPEEELNKTTRTQPALLVAGVAAWRCWTAIGGRHPNLVAGHSLGEYTALVAADALAFRDAIPLVAERGRLMQAAVPEGQGQMAAILGLEDAKVESICREAAGSQVVTVANYNSPGQVVIAGHSEAVDQAMSLAREAGAKRVLSLPVSVPSHCALMQDAAEKFAASIEATAFKDAAIPVVQNVDAQTRTDAAGIKAALIGQLYKPVRWVESVERIRETGVDVIIESGPGQVLAGLIKRIDRHITTIGIKNQDTLQTALQALSR